MEEAAMRQDDAAPYDDSTQEDGAALSNDP